MNDIVTAAKEYLSQAFYIDQHINSRLEQVASLRELATKVTGTLTDMPGPDTPNVYRLPEIVSKIVDAEEEINVEIDAFVDLKREMRACIACMNSPELQVLLEMRYLCFKPWRQIASDMGYCIAHIYRLHEQALKKFPVPVKDESKCD